MMMIIIIIIIIMMIIIIIMIIIINPLFPFHAFEKYTTKPQKLNFVMGKAVSLDCSCKCPCTFLHSYA